MEKHLIEFWDIKMTGSKIRPLRGWKNVQMWLPVKYIDKSKIRPLRGWKIDDYVEMYVLTRAV
ncbi:protein of unknown function [Methanocaldococcus lauensis]|nr:protein of unknown function [Methanocaldococcus lauensis]